MSAQHTPGTMSLQSIISITSSHHLVVDGRVIARVAKTDGRQDYSLPGEANARRLAACWNACEGVPTELLEAYPAPFTELLAALEKIAGFTLSQFMGPHDMALECVTVARAAIAKVKGGAL